MYVHSVKCYLVNDMGISVNGNCTPEIAHQLVIANNSPLQLAQFVVTTCTYTQFWMMRNQEVGRGLLSPLLLFSLFLEVEREGRGLDPLMNQPSAKKETPAKMAVPHAWEYHLLYCLMANFHCSFKVEGSGICRSGGFGYWACFQLPPDSGGFG